MSELEDKLAKQLSIMPAIPPFVREYKFHDKRRWKSDFAWPEYKLIVEAEGGNWSYGRHNRPEGFQKDCEKYNAINKLGYCLLRYTAKDIRDESAVLEINEWFESNQKLEEL